MVYFLFTLMTVFSLMLGSLFKNNLFKCLHILFTRRECENVELIVGNIVQENNKNEVERLDKQRHDDFLSMLRGFIVNQVSSLHS